MGEYEGSAVVAEAAALIAARTGVDIGKAAEALEADAAAFGLPLTEVAEDVVDVAHANRIGEPASLDQLLATGRPPGAFGADPPQAREGQRAT